MKKKYFFGVFIILALTFWAYKDVLQNPQAYYDDIGNIFNTVVASKVFDWTTIKSVLFFSYGGFRPVSYLSFYVNYLFWGNGIDNLFPFIYTNFLIHVLNILLVFALSIKLTKRNFRVSFLVSLAWAVSPANSLAVDYLVQRMTSLMFFFGMLSFLCFINYFEKKKLYLLFFSFLFFLLSILSKENGVLFVPLFFIYLVWFDYLKVDIKKLYIVFILIFILYVIAANNYFLPKAIERGFHPYERVVTELRVLVYYLKVLVLPFSSEVFLFLSFPMSKGLFSPITTFFSGLFLGVLFFLSLFLFNKNRLTSFGLLCFFVFQSVEASTAHLYVAFLHRNYVPSFFLYLALFSLLFQIIKKEFYVYVISFVLISNLVFVLKIHNAAFSSPFYYLSENYRYFPDNKDLCAAIGGMYSRVGKYKKSINFYIKSFRPDKFNNRLELISAAFFNMGCYDCVIQLSKLTKNALIYQFVAKTYKKRGDFKKAELYYKKSLALKISRKTVFSYLDMLSREGRYKEVLYIINKYRAYLGQNELLVMYQINSHIELGEFEKAKPLFNKLKSPDVIFWLKGKYFLKKGYTDKSINYLQKIKSDSLAPADLFIGLQKVLLLSDAYEKKGNFKESLKILNKYKRQGVFVNIIDKKIKQVKEAENNAGSDIQK